MPTENKVENKRTKQARESRAQILNGYIELQQERGDNFTVQELCQYLQISVGRFYHHFKSKDDLFHNVYCIWDVEANDPPLGRTITDPRNEVIRQAVLFARSNKAHGVAFVQKLFSGNNTKLSEKGPRPAYVEIAVKSFWETHHLQDCYTLEEITRHIRVLTRGVIFDWAIHNGDFDIEEAMRVSISNALDGFLVTAAGKRLYHEGCTGI